MVDFRKHELVLVPFSTEIKDKYWTTGKSVSVHQKTVKCKTLALDGRLLHKPPEEDKAKTFSIFWTVPRVQKKSEANLLLEWSEVPISTRVKLPFRGKCEAGPMSGDIKVPVLINPEKIPKFTQLFALDDLALRKLAKDSTDAEDKAAAKK